MLAGQRAFRGDTAADTITAILTKEPPDLSQTNKDIHPGLDRIVRHCLEKNPEERFESARDVAFDLEALSSVSSPTGVTGARAIPVESKRRPWLMLVLAAVLGAAIASPFVFKAGKKAGFVQPPAFRQITFSRGEVGSSLFAPDGQTIVYSAGWEGKPFEIFINRPESPESRPFGLGAAEVLAISKSGEMAVSLNRHPLHSFVRSGRLARISIAGGAPRDILDDVQFADWGPDGQSLAIVRDAGIKNRLEYPIGKTLFETTGWVGQVRVSPKEELIAFVDHPFQNDDGGRIAVVDKAGKKKDLTPLYATAQGLAWTPDGREIWYTAAEGGFNRAVHAVTTVGKTSSRRPRAGHQHDPRHLEGRQGPDDQRERAPRHPRARRRRREGAGALLARLFAGHRHLSGRADDSHHGVGRRRRNRATPRTCGRPTTLPRSASAPEPRKRSRRTERGRSPSPTLRGRNRLRSCFCRPASASRKRCPARVWIRSPPTSCRMASRSSTRRTQAGHGTRLYLRDVAGGKSRALTPEGYFLFRGTITPDAKSVVVRGPDRRIYLYPLAGGEPRALAGLGAEAPAPRDSRRTGNTSTYRKTRRSPCGSTATT